MDEYFVEILPMLEKIVKGVAYKNNKKIDTYVAINEGYIHMIKNKSNIKTKKDLEKLVVNFLNMNIIWTNSQINKQERVGEHNDKLNAKHFYGGYDESDETTQHTNLNQEEQIDEIDIELEQKIEIEKWWDEKKSILHLYRNQEDNKIKQVIFDCYFSKGITKGTELAKHLNINKDYGCKYIREMKLDINTYYKKWLTDNNK